MLDTNPLMPYDCCPREEDMSQHEQNFFIKILKQNKQIISIIIGTATIIWFVSSKFHSYGSEFEKQMHSIDKQLVGMEKRLDDRIVKLEKDMTIVKTILLMKNEYPKELATRKD